MNKEILIRILMPIISSQDTNHYLYNSREHVEYFLDEIEKLGLVIKEKDEL